jgi:O-antigen/teichoic acid export membrane protein
MNAETGLQTRFPSGASLDAWAARCRQMLRSTTGTGALALVDQGVVSGTSFLTTVLVGRWAGLEELGVFALALVLLMLISGACESLLWTPYTVFSNRNRNDLRSQCARCALSLQIVAGGVAAGGLAVVAAVLSLGAGSAGLGGVVGVLAVAAPFYLLREFARRALLARLDVAGAIVLDVAIAAVQLGAVVVLHLEGRLAASTAFGAIALSSAVTGIGWIVLARCRPLVHRRRVAAGWRKHWRFGRWIFAGQWTDMFQRYALYWVVAALLGSAATGMFAACASVIAVLNPLVLGIGSVLVPYASRAFHTGGRPAIRRVVGRTTAVLAACAAVFCLPLVLFGSRVLEVVYRSDGSSGQGAVVAVLALGALVAACSFAADNGLWVLGRSDVNFKAGLAGLIVTGVATTALATAGGVVGAAIGSLIGVTMISAIKSTAFVRLSSPSMRGSP